MKDISVIITIHNEGRLLHHTLRSAIKAIKYAQKQGLETEMINILDSITPETKNYIKRSELYKKHDIKKFSVKYKSAGTSRNHGIKKSEGKYITFLDGDDLYAKDWLVKAYQFAEKNKNSILHPEYSLFFGDSYLLWKRTSSDSKNFDFKKLMYSNLWDALSFGPKEIYKKVPYQALNKKSNFGGEDWTWNCDTLGKDYKHLIVPDTINFIRNRGGSKSSARKERNSLPGVLPPNKLFQNYMSEVRNKQSIKLDATTKFNLKSFIKYDILGAKLSKDLYILSHDLKNQILTKIKKRKRDIFPSELEYAVQDIKTIEPQVHSNNLQWYRNIPFTDFSGMKYFKLYELLVQDMPEKSTDIIFAKTEDADIDLNINLPDEEKPYVYKFPMKFNKFFAKKYLTAFLTLLERIVLDSTLDRVHIINDHQIIRVIEKYQDSSLIDKFFILHITKRFNDYSFFNKVFNVVSYIFVSSSEIKDDLVTIYGVDKDKIKVTKG